MSDRDSFYTFILIAGAMVSVWIAVAVCFEGLIPFFFCPLKHIFGIQCPFCKLTRACACLFRGEVGAALQTTPLIAALPLITVFPLSVYDVCMNKNFVYSIYTLIMNNQKLSRTLLFTLFSSVLGVWILNF